MQYKEKVNKLIDEFMLTDNVNKMIAIVCDRINSIDIQDSKNFENQVMYYYYSLLSELLYGLKDKRIGFVKAGLIRFKGQDLPIVVDILKKIL